MLKFQRGGRRTQRRFRQFLALALVLLSAPHTLLAQSDDGASDSISLFLNAVTNMSEALELETTLAEWTAREKRLVAEARTGLRGREQAAGELFRLGEAYWSKTRYEEAIRNLEAAIDLAPDSYAAARSWMLIGNTYLGNFASPQRSIEPFSSADRILQSLLVDGKVLNARSRDLAYRDRGIILSRLGFVAVVENRPEDAVRYYTELLDSPDLSRCVQPGFLLNANRQLAELAVAREDRDAAEKYLSAVENILREGKAAADDVIRARLETILATWPDPQNPERLAALRELWENPDYAAEPAILLVGDELSFAYFFRKPPAWKEFQEVSPVLLERAQQHLSEERTSELSPTDRLYVRNLLLALERARTQADSDRLEELSQLFQKTYQDRPIQLSVPARRARIQAERLHAIYVSSFPEHFEQMQLRLERSGSSPESLRPTPARPSR